MDHYIDILLKPDLEIRESHLMSLVYTKFHKILVQLKAEQIGVSFPDYKIKLGRLLRLHGSEVNLKQLESIDWLGGILGYCEVSHIKLVPADVKYRTVSRIRPTMSQSKLSRLKRRGSMTPDKEKAYKANMFSVLLTNPYLDMDSGSTGQRHRRFIHFGSLIDKSITGTFDSFGLSKNATIPWF